MSYIDSEKFKRKLIDEKSFFPAAVASALKEMPPEDVVPKAEADFLRADRNLKEAELNEAKAELELRKAEIKTLKAALEVSALETAEKIFEDVWASIASRAYASKSADYAEGALDAVEWVDSKIAEVQKKYIGEQSDENEEKSAD